MSFYENFEKLCSKKGITPTKAARDIGVAQPVVSQWKKRGSTPKAETIQKLADYFGVSTADLIGRVELANEKGVYINPDDYIEAIRPYLADLEPLSGREVALNTLLNEMGYNILKAKGKYFFSYENDGSEISGADLTELFNCAKNGLKVAAKTLELKLLQESLTPRYRRPDAPPPFPEVKEPPPMKSPQSRRKMANRGG